MSKIQETQTGFINIDNAMAIARARYKANPELESQVEPNPFISTEDDLDFNERYGIAFTQSQSLLMQTRLQLAAPCVAPHELTAGEWSEKAEADEWDYRYQRADTVTDRMLVENDDLFENVMGTICDLECDKALLLGDVDVPGPPASPKLEYIRGVPEDVRQWLRNSKQQWRENVVREAGYKPVMVVKSEVPSDGEGQKRGNGVGGFLKRVLSVKRR